MSEITEEFKTWWETSLHEASFSKNHFPYPPPDSTLWWAWAAWQVGKAAEREACAKVAESYEPRCEVCPRGVSSAIRARG